MTEEFIKVPTLSRALDFGDIEIRKETGQPESNSAGRQPIRLSGFLAMKF